MRHLVELALVAPTAFAALLLFGGVLGARSCRRHQRRAAELSRPGYQPRPRLRAGPSSDSPEEPALR